MPRKHLELIDPPHLTQAMTRGRRVNSAAVGVQAHTAQGAAGLVPAQGLADGHGQSGLFRRLQRSTGNRAMQRYVGEMLRGDSRSSRLWSSLGITGARLVIHREAQLGWSTEKKGPNAGEVSSGSWDFGQVRRIALQGFGSGRAARSRQAIVLIPVAVASGTPQSAAGQAASGQGSAPLPDMPDPVEVLFHLHGHRLDTGITGYEGGNLETVRDVARQQIPQQLQKSGRRMIAVLPQGGPKSEFGITDPVAYIEDVFQGLKEIGAWQPYKEGPPISRVIFSGHSGGGDALYWQLLANKGKVIATMGGLFLFDAINVKVEQTAVHDWVEAQLNRDLNQLTDSQRLNNPAKQREYLAGSMRFFGTYTTGYATRYQPVQNLVDGWWGKDEVKKLDPAVVAEWKKHYVVKPAGHGAHEYVVGTGARAQKGQGGPGALFDALSALPPGTQTSLAGQTQAKP